MTSNLERYRTDLDTLIQQGRHLKLAIWSECYPEQLKRVVADDATKKKTAEALPSFRDTYQAWYSEAHALVKQLLPDRLADFVSHYEQPKGRKVLDGETYRIYDYLQGLSVRRAGEIIVGGTAAVPHFEQQLRMVEAVVKRFETSLFDIRQLLQADMFDSEVDTAVELAKKGFGRAAGAVAGVVLEKHLSGVCESHGVAIRKKKPTIADYNDALKEAGTIELSTWRFIQHLGDIRNLCDHDKKQEPTIDQVGDLVAGVAKVIKTVF
jgi:hypothetical protein